MTEHCFFSVDWGTSRLRVRLVDVASGEVLAAVATDQGAAALASQVDNRPDLRADRFAAVAREHVAAIKASHAPDGRADHAPVVISGMASSSIGWQELPYARLPFPLDGSALATRHLGPLGGGHPGPVILVSGVRSEDDVIRGEEVELMGLGQLMRLPDDVTIVLPGTHSKHLVVRADVLISFRTFVTGELFDILCRHSVLRHSTDITVGLEGDEAAFEAGVRQGADAGMALTASLFRVRTRQVLDASSSTANTAFLSGVLIGSELSMLRGAAAVVIAAAPPLESRYRAAAGVLGLNRVDGPAPSQMAMAAVRAHRRIVCRASDNPLSLSPSASPL